MIQNIDILEKFELEIGMLDDNLNKPTTTESEFWINAGLEKFWKTRYSGINYKQRGFEQDQKRTDDLRTLVVTKTYDTVTAISDSEYCVEIPENYAILLGDTASILPLNDKYDHCWSTDEDGNYIPRKTDTLEGTIETIDRQLENSLSEHKIKYCQAKPIRTVRTNKIYLYTDGNYQVSSYKLIYLRLPHKIEVHQYPFDEFKDLPEHTVSEFVKIAAQMYIENKHTSVQQNQRVTTHATEVLEME